MRNHHQPRSRDEETEAQRNGAALPRFTWEVGGRSEAQATRPALRPRTEAEAPSVRARSLQSQTVARQAPLSMGFPKPEYWSVLPCPLPGDLPKPGIKPGSSAMQADSLPLSWYTSI